MYTMQLVKAIVSFSILCGVIFSVEYYLPPLYQYYRVGRHQLLSLNVNVDIASLLPCDLM